MTEYADPKPVLDAELLAVDGVPVADLMPQQLQYPPAVRARCACRKNGTPEAHGFNPETGHRAFSCAEVLAIQARVEADLTRRPTLAARLTQRFVDGA